MKSTEASAKRRWHLWQLTDNLTPSTFSHCFSASVFHETEPQSWICQRSRLSAISWFVWTSYSYWKWWVLCFQDVKHMQQTSPEEFPPASYGGSFQPSARDFSEAATHLQHKGWGEHWKWANGAFTYIHQFSSWSAMLSAETNARSSKLRSQLQEKRWCIRVRSW